MTRIAIVGAGVSGLTTAHALRTRSLDVQVFEKSRGYGGRVAARSRYGSRYDHGASYFTTASDRARRLVRAHLPTDGLVKIGRPIWHFDETGTLSRPPASPEQTPKWTYRQGISQLGKLLARFSGAEVRTETRVERLSRDQGRWTVHTREGGAYAPFDAVVLTPPAPQTVTILAKSEGGDERGRRLQRAVEAVEYTAQFSYVFAFDRPLSRPGDFYAARHTEDQHPLSWIAFEHDKPGHVRAGHSMLVVQTAPEWTAERLEQEPDAFVPDVKEAAEDVLVADLRRPAWYDVQRWRYARPEAGLDPEPLDAGASIGLLLAGDAVSGVGRVETALETGFETARRIREEI